MRISAGPNRTAPARIIGLACICILWLSASVSALQVEKSLGPHEFCAEFADPYYAATGLYFSLTNKPMPSLDSTAGESRAYGYLLRHALRPSMFLVEVGVYPLPLVGVAAKEWGPSVYNRAVIGKTNLIQMFTGSVNFKEPWSVSAFLGNAVKFCGSGATTEGRGNIGYLATYGYYHIKDNTIYPDHWGEFEAKIKIDRGGKERKFATSYRIGGRIHSNPDIRDLVYVSLFRNRTDFEEKRFSFINNTNFQIRGDVGFRRFELLRLSLEAGKKYPLHLGKKELAIGLSLGITYNAANPYCGAMGEGFVPRTLSPIVRPLIQF